MQPLKICVICMAFVLTPLANLNVSVAQSVSMRKTVNEGCAKVVKIIGSGGFQGLESYQTGILISNDGYILTVWSYVLDQDEVTVTLGDGFKSQGRLVGYDPQLQIALLKVDAKQLPFFDLDNAATGRTGQRVLAFSNLYKIATGDEPASVQFGFISAHTPLDVRSGSFTMTLPGEIYVVDAMTNNPGAPGGALTNHRGEILGLIGKEVRNVHNNAWINFAIPISSLTESIQAIRSGKLSVAATNENSNGPAEPMSSKLLGFRMVPEVVSRTPPYVDYVREDSPAARNGILPDDLIIEIDGRLTPTRKDVESRLLGIDRDATVNLTLQRGKHFLKMELRLGR